MIEALEALLASPGWKAYVAFVKSEWSPAACWGKTREQPGDLAKIDYTNQQVGILMRWPEQELARLKRQTQEPEPTMSRGGYR